MHRPGSQSRSLKTRPLKTHYPFVQIDAIYLKVRENGHVESKELLVAVGINEEGHREVIGFILLIVKLEIVEEHSLITSKN